MTAKRKGAVTARYRWMVVARLLAATVGGYVVASLFGALTAFALPMLSRLTLADGVVIGTMLGFVVHAGLFVFAFSPVRAGRVWAWLLGAGILLGVMLWAAGGNAWFPPAPR
jgi:uncharacterized membrane protein